MESANKGVLPAKRQQAGLGAGIRVVQAKEDNVVNEYYDNDEVRTRMIEFMGGNSQPTISSIYLTAGDTHLPRHRQPIATEKLEDLWRGQFDISRSLWDRESLIFHLDVEYVNFDAPGEVFLQPGRAYELQRPVELAIEAILLDYGIRPLHLLSGRGHHFVWRIRQDSAAFNRLAELGRVSPTLEVLNGSRHRPNGETLPAQLGKAYAGLGLAMEYLAHRIKDEAAPQCEIPVTLTAVEAGPGSHGREVVSIDISEYGDPLSARVIRVPFSYYLKPLQQDYLFAGTRPRPLMPVFLMPLQGIDFHHGLRVMRDMSRVLELAKSVDTRIPDASRGVGRLLEAYRESPLRKYHDWFYAGGLRRADEPGEPGAEPLWPSLPLCARQDLEHPNDLLLKPAHIQRFVRVMLALGWHPRRIAGLLQTLFEGDYAWGEQWGGYSPALRAEFYVRLFAGAFVSGPDNLVDFNCQSAKEEMLCTSANCPFNLALYRTSLMNRKKYERLARRPFNRLFLPEEHLRLPGADPAQRLQHD